MICFVFVTEHLTAESKSGEFKHWIIMDTSKTVYGLYCGTEFINMAKLEMPRPSQS